CCAHSPLYPMWQSRKYQQPRTNLTSRSDITMKNNHMMKSWLSPARQRLVEMAERLGFGTIFGLHYKLGEPIFDPHPRIVRRVKIGARRAVRSCSNYILKAAWHELFSEFDRTRSGIVESLKVADGIPVLFDFEEAKLR